MSVFELNSYLQKRYSVSKFLASQKGLLFHPFDATIIEWLELNFADFCNYVYNIWGCESSEWDNHQTVETHGKVHMQPLPVRRDCQGFQQSLYLFFAECDSCKERTERGPAGLCQKNRKREILYQI